MLKVNPQNIPKTIIINNYLYDYIKKGKKMLSTSKGQTETNLENKLK